MSENQDVDAFKMLQPIIGKLGQKDDNGLLYQLFKYRLGVIQRREHFNAIADQRQEKSAYDLILDMAKKYFEELTNVRLFNLKYGDPDISKWNQQTLNDLAQKYQVKTIEKIKKWFGASDE